MATIRKFTEIKAWQEGRVLAKEVYSVTRKAPFSKDYGLSGQLQRAVVSINSNIAEGFERDSKSEFIQFLGYAKGSAGEALSQMITAHDIGYVNDDDFNRISQHLEFVSILIARFRESLGSSPHQGIRWKNSSHEVDRRIQPRNLETAEP